MKGIECIEEYRKNRNDFLPMIDHERLVLIRIDFFIPRVIMGCSSAVNRARM